MRLVPLEAQQCITSQDISSLTRVAICATHYTDKTNTKTVFTKCTLNIILLFSMPHFERCTHVLFIPLLCVLLTRCKFSPCTCE